MHDIMKDRILRRLETLPEDRLYQVLDYIEFLESKYAERQAPGPNVFQRFAEGVEDTLRAGNVSVTAVSEAMGFMSKAMGVLNSVAAAGRSVAGGAVTPSRPASPSAGTSKDVAPTGTAPKDAASTSAAPKDAAPKDAPPRTKPE